jgi:hypothetical protein
MKITIKNIEKIFKSQKTNEDILFEKWYKLIDEISSGLNWDYQTKGDVFKKVKIILSDYPIIYTFVTCDVLFYSICWIFVEE